MKKILEHLGFELVEKNKATSTVSVRVFYSKENKVKWILPLNAREPLFLKSFETECILDKLNVLRIKTIYKLKLQFLLGKKINFYLKNKPLLNPSLDLSGSNWALSNFNEKIIFFNERTNLYTKIVKSDRAQKMVYNEMKFIKKIEALNLKTTKVPKLIELSPTKVQWAAISFATQKNQGFSEIHQKALTEYYQKSLLKLSEFRIPAFATAHLSLKKLKAISDVRIPQALVTNLISLLSNTKSKEISVAIGNGSFCPSNIFINNDKLIVNNWEKAAHFLPVGYDAFHYIMQDGLMQKKSWLSIKQEILAIKTSVFNNWARDLNANIMEYFKFYLLINTTAQLSLLASQENCNVQFVRSLELYSEAVLDLINIDQRETQTIYQNFYEVMLEKKNTLLNYKAKEVHILS